MAHIGLMFIGWTLLFNDGTEVHQTEEDLLPGILFGDDRTDATDTTEAYCFHGPYTYDDRPAIAQSDLDGFKEIKEDKPSKKSRRLKSFCKRNKIFKPYITKINKKQKIRSRRKC